MSAEEAEEARRRLAAIKQEKAQVKLQILAHEEKELLRKLNSGMLSAEEEAALRKRLEAIGKERDEVIWQALLDEEKELQRKLKVCSLGRPANTSHLVLLTLCW